MKLSSADAGGAFFLFENAVPPGRGVPPHVHSREDEVLGAPWRRLLNFATRLWLLGPQCIAAPGVGTASSPFSALISGTCRPPRLAYRGA